MTTPKNQNSILVLATLGVYIGLILAGATPQVLAQAAMARQFDVKDEVEVKDEFDTKPADSDSADTRPTVDVTTSIERFLEKFKQPSGVGPLFSLTENVVTVDPPVRSTPLLHPSRHEYVQQLDSLLIVTCLPRAGLDAPLANDAW